jgi:hypothetical protein
VNIDNTPSVISPAGLYTTTQACALLGVEKRWLRRHVGSLGTSRKRWYKGADLLGALHWFPPTDERPVSTTSVFGSAPESERSRILALPREARPNWRSRPRSR